MLWAEGLLTVIECSGVWKQRALLAQCSGALSVGSGAGSLLEFTRGLISPMALGSQKSWTERKPRGRKSTSETRLRDSLGVQGNRGSRYLS